MASNVALPELRCAEHGPADWTFEFKVGGYAVKNADPFHRWRQRNGVQSLEFARAAEGLVLRFPGMARFVVRVDERCIDGYPSNRLPFGAVRPTLLNIVMPLVFGRERLVLHASAVATPSGAVAFVGRPGSGKSTLAAALARAGCAFLTDDVLVLREASRTLEAVPSQLALRVWIDSARELVGSSAKRLPRVGRHTEKRVVAPDDLRLATAGMPIPLRRIYVLGRAATGRASIAPIFPSEAAIALMRNSFQLEVDRPEVVRRALEWVGMLIAQTTQRRLRVAFDFRRLPALVETVMNDLAR